MIRFHTILRLIAAVLVCCGWAAAQQAQPVDHAGAAAPAGTASKRNFARALASAGTLDSLRDLAVFNQGRVKILDTLARESVRSLTGKPKFADVPDPAAGEPKSYKFDPVFTYLDMAFDPAFYEARPLIYVEYLPLREAFLEHAYADAASREYWKRQGRIAPATATAYFGDIAREKPQDTFQRGLNSIVEAVGIYRGAEASLAMVAPESTEKQWGGISSLDPGSPAGAAWRQLRTAWRSADAGEVRSAAASLSAELPKINPHMYPGGRRAMERTYNASNPFEWGYWAYFVAMVSLLIAFGTGRRWLTVTGIVTLLLAVGLHAFGFGVRCILAERFAIQNQFESMTGLSLFAALVGTTLMLARRQWLFGAAASGVGFMVLITATQTGFIPGVNIQREAAILNTSVLLKYHVTTVLVSYGLISLGFITSLFYLATYYGPRLKARGVLGGPGAAPQGVVGMSAAALNLGEDAPKGQQRILSDLDRAQMIILQLAFWGLGTGILLGAWWADHSWGRWWAFDPKELWALITWIVYLVVVHVRVSGAKNRALLTAWLSVLGFFVMLWCYFGVNLILPGLHAYA